MSVHQGDIIRKRVDESGIAIKEVAKRIGRTRGALYSIFERAKVSADLILKIGHAIRHDFTDDFKNLRELSLVMEPDAEYGLSPAEIIKSLERELLDCKAKCFDLMEENALLLNARYPVEL